MACVALLRARTQGNVDRSLTFEIIKRRLKVGSSRPDTRRLLLLLLVSVSVPILSPFHTRPTADYIYLHQSFWGENLESEYANFREQQTGLTAPTESVAQHYVRTAGSSLGAREKKTEGDIVLYVKIVCPSVWRHPPRSSRPWVCVRTTPPPQGSLPSTPPHKC